MSKPYRNKKWLNFRQEVIDLDGNCCSVCHRLESDGVILQVHHKHYVEGKSPWEYSYGDCETLCKGCHAREHGLIPPSSGWRLVCEEDLGELNTSCELCGTSLRYVFTVHHRHWEPLNVGTNCCDHLTGTKIASEHMNSKNRYEERLKRFQESSRWKQSGRRLRIHQKDIYADIVTIENGFVVYMNGVRGKKIYQAIDEAKIKIFQTIEDGTAQKCLISRNKMNNG